MSETKTTGQDKGATWVRYRHRERPDIEYEVKVSTRGDLVAHHLGGEPCYRIRTIRNLSHREEAHRPAYTYMPADRFLDVYEKAA